MQLTFSLESLAQTDALGHALALLLEAGDCLALHGDLGAGKTTLVRAIARTMGVDQALVSSPTFVIVNEYPLAPSDPPSSNTAQTATTLVHVDAYRLTSTEDLDALGWDQLDDGSSVLLIEWAQRIADALDPRRTADLHLTILDEDSRAVALTLPDTWQDRAGLAQLRAIASTSANTTAERTATTCPVTGQPVPADSPTWPFVSEQARMADLYKWFSGQHNISRPVDQTDLEEEV